MNYVIDLHRTEYSTEEVQAESRDEAMAKAKAQWPDFRVDSVGELNENGDLFNEHEPISFCENCECNIWDDMKYFTTQDDATLCETCFNGLKP